MSKLLLDKHPLLVIPNLAVLVGLNEAIILQQIHYWIEINREADKNFREGFYWTYNSYENWQRQFPFWSVITIKRAITSLRKKGLIVCANYNQMTIDRTQWYRIDYPALKIVSGNGRIKMTPPSYQNDTIGKHPKKQASKTKEIRYGARYRDNLMAMANREESPDEILY